MQRPHSDNDFESDRQDESDVSLLDNAQQQTLQQQKKNKDLNGKYMNTRAKRRSQAQKKIANTIKDTSDVESNE